MSYPCPSEITWQLDITADPEPATPPPPQHPLFLQFPYKLLWTPTTGALRTPVVAFSIPNFHHGAYPRELGPFSTHQASCKIVWGACWMPSSRSRWHLTFVAATQEFWVPVSAQLSQTCPPPFGILGLLHNAGLDWPLDVWTWLGGGLMLKAED